MLPKSLLRTIVYLSLIWGANTVHAAEQPQILYDVPVSESWWHRLATRTWQGHQIRLANGPRRISQIDINYAMQNGTSGTVDVEARVYLNDGPDGLPGKLLWASERLVDQPIIDRTYVTFGVPFVEVPSDITLITRIFRWRSSHGDPSLTFSESLPTDGVVLSDIASTDLETFSRRFENSLDIRLAARIYAVPEPGSQAVSIVVLALFFSVHHRWTRTANS